MWEDKSTDRRKQGGYRNKSTTKKLVTNATKSFIQGIFSEERAKYFARVCYKIKDTLGPIEDMGPRAL